MYDFDNFVSDVKKAADVVASKTGEVIDASKVQIEKSQVKVVIKEKYQELGKLCYQSVENGYEDTTAMQTLVNEIKGLKAKLKSLDGMCASNTVKQRVCPACGFANPAEFEYCSKCGTQL